MATLQAKKDNNHRLGESGVSNITSEIQDTESQIFESKLKMTFAKRARGKHEKSNQPRNHPTKNHFSATQLPSPSYVSRKKNPIL